MAEKEERKYIVIKMADLDKISKQMRQNNWDVHLENILEAIRILRDNDGRPTDNKYIICNQDEPYAEKVWQTILEGEDAKPMSMKKLEEAGKFLTKDKELPWPAGRGTH